MTVRLLLFFLFTIGGQIQSFAQCAAIDFSINPAVCLNERTVVEDTGLASLSDWDFCSGDFSQTPSAQLDYTLSAALGRPGIEFAKDGNLWYAFVTGTWASTLYRVRFANGLNSAPTSVDNLGDLGGKLIGPGQVRILKKAMSGLASFIMRDLPVASYLNFLLEICFQIQSLLVHWLPA